MSFWNHSPPLSGDPSLRASDVMPTPQEVEALVRRHYGPPCLRGWRVRMSHRFGFFSPEDWYQCVVARLVTAGCRWVDVGGGRSVFPYNTKLSMDLANRCALLVGVDPSDNVEHNELVHKAVKARIEDFTSEDKFDLATLRMVAEHIAEPKLLVRALSRLIKPRGHVVLYTPHRWSPVSIAASLIPNQWHHHVTRFLWNVDERDVFPTYYRMNTRRCLRRLFRDGGFDEVCFAYLANCSSFERFRVTYFLELCAWRSLRAIGLRYPECNLLGIYKRNA